MKVLWNSDYKTLLFVNDAANGRPAIANFIYVLMGNQDDLGGGAGHLPARIIFRVLPVSLGPIL